jgi:hypothetical protein
MFASLLARALTRPLSSNPTLDQLANSSAAAGVGYVEAQTFAECRGAFDCRYRDDGSRRIELQRLDSPAYGTPRFP